MNDYKLAIFDLDGTLAPFKSHVLYEDAAVWFAACDLSKVAVASNQGGVGLRAWMESNNFGEPGKYPTLDDVITRLGALFPEQGVAGRGPRLYFSCRYQSQSSGKWSPVPPGCEELPMWRQDWRKPLPGMLLAAIADAGVAPGEALMVGDSAEDLLAARAAGCQFLWAWNFFGRPEPLTPEEGE